MNDEYILPSELFALVAFWFAPPVLLAWSVQSWLFAKRGVFQGHRWRAISAFAITLFGGIAVGLASLVVGAPFLPHWLGVIDARLSNTVVLVLPLSFTSVFIVAVFAFRWCAKVSKHAAQQGTPADVLAAASRRQGRG